MTILSAIRNATAEELDGQLVRELDVRECPHCDGAGFDADAGGICRVCMGACLVPVEVATRYLSGAGLVTSLSVESRRLRERNDRTLADMPGAERARLEGLRVSATDFALGLADLQSREAGTTWGPIRAAVPLEVERLIRSGIAITLAPPQLDPGAARERSRVLAQLTDERISQVLAMFSRRELKELGDSPDRMLDSFADVSRSLAGTDDPLAVPVLNWFFKKANEPVG